MTAERGKGLRTQGYSVQPGAPGQNKSGQKVLTRQQQQQYDDGRRVTVRMGWCEVDSGGRCVEGLVRGARVTVWR